MEMNEGRHSQLCGKMSRDFISMDFIVGFPLTARRQDSIFVVVNTLTKSSHFIPMHTMYQAPDIANVFINEIVRLHGMPKNIISNWGSVFTGWFWTSFQEALWTQLNFSTVYHPKTDGKTKRANQTLRKCCACTWWTKKRVGKNSCH